METTTIKAGESLSIGLWFKDDFILPQTTNMIVYIGGVCVGNLLTQVPAITRSGIYYDIKLSGEETFKMRGYRDLIIIFDDPGSYGVLKNVVGGISFERLADEYDSASETNGYNIIIGLKISESEVSYDVDFIEALRGPKGDPGPKGDDSHYRHTQTSASSIWNIKHNLGKHPSVSVESSSGYVVIGEVQYIDDNNLTIKFSASLTGFANLN